MDIPSDRHRPGGKNRRERLDPPKFIDAKFPLIRLIVIFDYGNPKEVEEEIDKMRWRFFF